MANGFFSVFFRIFSNSLVDIFMRCLSYCHIKIHRQLKSAYLLCDKASLKNQTSTVGCSFPFFFSFVYLCCLALFFQLPLLEVARRMLQTSTTRNIFRPCQKRETILFNSFSISCIEIWVIIPLWGTEFSIESRKGIESRCHSWSKSITILPCQWRVWKLSCSPSRSWRQPIC